MHLGRSLRLHGGATDAQRCPISPTCITRDSRLFNTQSVSFPHIERERTIRAVEEGVADECQVHDIRGPCKDSSKQHHTTSKPPCFERRRRGHCDCSNDAFLEQLATHEYFGPYHTALSICHPSRPFNHHYHPRIPQTLSNSSPNLRNPLQKMRSSTNKFSK